MFSTTDCINHCKKANDKLLAEKYTDAALCIYGLQEMLKRVAFWHRVGNAAAFAIGVIVGVLVVSFI